MSERERKEFVRATEAHSDLYVFGVVISIMEGGNLHAASYKAAERITDICKREMDKRLREYDAAAAKLGVPYGSPQSAERPVRK